ncbi:hypothetical protein B0H19DRAFT_1235512 [Mycena capillaripes]|nr:hypothetical protein B0H19DRAFT_1235512 [Mycena capillaripes]
MYVTESYSYIGSLPVRGQTKQSPGVQYPSSNIATMGMNLPTKLQMISSVLNNQRILGPRDIDSSIPPATDTGMSEVTELKNQPWWAASVFKRRGSQTSEKQAERTCSSVSEIRLSQRSFHGFNFGDRDKNVWSEGDVVGGKELGSGQAVSRRNACASEEEHAWLWAKVYGETERKMKPSKEFEVLNLPIIFVRWLAWTSGARALFHKFAGDGATN